MKGSVGMFSKAKAAKLIRELIDQFLNMRPSARKGKEVERSMNIIIDYYYYYYYYYHVFTCFY